MKIDRLAPIIYVVIQMILLLPTIIRAQEEILDLTQVFTYIFWGSIILAFVFYFMTHCADPGYIPLEHIALTDNSQSSRIQQVAKRSFISQLLKGKGNQNDNHDGGDGGDTNKNTGIKNKYDFKVDSKHTDKEEDENTNKNQSRQQKYLKHLMNQKKNEFIEFKDDEEDGQTPVNLNALSDNKTPIKSIYHYQNTKQMGENQKNKVYQQKQQNVNNNDQEENDDGNRNNADNYIPDCELSVDLDESKQKNNQQSFKFEDSSQSAEKQDFIVGLQDIQFKSTPFSPPESRNRSFEKNKEGEEFVNENNVSDANNPNYDKNLNKDNNCEKIDNDEVKSAQDIESDSKQVCLTEAAQQQSQQNYKKYQSEKQISFPTNELFSTNAVSPRNNDKQISKETTQMEEGSTKFTCKTTTQEQFTTQTLEKKTSPYNPCFRNDDEDEEGQTVVKQIQQNQNIDKSKGKEQNVTPFQVNPQKSDCNELHQIDSNRNGLINNEKDLTFEKDQKHTNDDHIITDNENDIKSQVQIQVLTPVNQMIFFTNNSNNNPSSMFQFNMNNPQNEKSNLQGDDTKSSAYKEGENSIVRPKWSRKKNSLQNNDIENQSSNRVFSDYSTLNKNNSICTPNPFLQQNQLMPFAEKRYCTTCYINMPLRTKHCKDCKRCVSKFDHHCPYVGNCIGERNKCVFFWFLIVQLNELVVGFLEILKQNRFDDSGELIYNIYTIFCFIIIAFFFIFVLLLFIYHSYFGSRNITTWEYASWEKISYLQDIPYEFGSPFSMGALKNCISFCTFRLSSSKISDPSYVRYPQNLIELQQIKQQQEQQLQNINYLDLNNNNNQHQIN